MLRKSRGILLGFLLLLGFAIVFISAAQGRSQAWRDGYDSAALDVPIEDCPHKGAFLKHAWEDGWRYARREK